VTLTFSADSFPFPVTKCLVMSWMAVIQFLTGTEIFVVTTMYRPTLRSTHFPVHCCIFIWGHTTKALCTCIKQWNLECWDLCLHVSNRTL